MADSIEGHGAVRLELNYKLFKGASIQFHDGETAEDQAKKIAALPAVKHMWPVKAYGFEKSTVQIVGDGARKSARAETDAFPPHVMTQVDKLHAKGIKGLKKTKVAVIDTGVSLYMFIWACV